MPVYTYKCHDCSKIFDVRHGMFFEHQRCVSCQSENVFRLPPAGITGIVEKKEQNSTKPGQVVDQYIKDAKEEVKREKKKLKSEEM